MGEAATLGFIMKLLSTAALGAAFVVSSAISASALTIVAASATCDASSPIPASFATFTTQCATDPSRNDAGAVNIGAADGNFFSLGINQTPGGFGGAAIFEISPAFTGPAMVVEVTNPSNHKEAAEVFVANDLVELQTKYFAGDFAGIVDNGEGGATTANTTITITGVYKYIMFADLSHVYYGVAGNGTQDGFDLDAFTVTPVPLPAGVLLLGTALAGLGLSRRRA